MHRRKLKKCYVQEKYNVHTIMAIMFTKFSLIVPGNSDNASALLRQEIRALIGARSQQQQQQQRVSNNLQNNLSGQVSSDIEALGLTLQMSPGMYNRCGKFVLHSCVS